MRIGIDVGGTNTDAALLDGGQVIAGIKQSTSPDVTSGITAALEALKIEQSFDAAQIDGIMIGTTHFINALVEANRLAPTAALRLGLPATSALPPLVGWPERLVEAIAGRVYMAHGGFEFDGRPISPLDADELREQAADMRAHGIGSVAISSVFSPINDQFELDAARILAEELGDGVALSLSHQIGRVGLLERENATIINAALRELADGIVGRLESTLQDLGYSAPLFLSQNDGTLMDLAYARQYPVATFASGPTNSMRGAAVTSGLATCAVIDVGGTTSDVGVLTNGFPREATTEVEVAGVRTNFRMPDVLSIGIGGGSIITVDGEATAGTQAVAPESIAVGPDSVGYKLTSEALVFGGNTLTATDVAVAAGRATVGDPEKVAHLDPEFVAAVLDEIGHRFADTVERMRTSAEPLPVVGVGGGAILLPDGLPDLGKVVKPENSGVANAIGAAIAQVSGEIDKVFSIAPGTRDEVVAEAKGEATSRAIAAGATAETAAIVEFDEVPLPYLPGGATRIRAKAVGDLALAE